MAYRGDNVGSLVDIQKKEDWNEKGQFPYSRLDEEVVEVMVSTLTNLD